MVYDKIYLRVLLGAITYVSVGGAPGAIGIVVGDIYRLFFVEQSFHSKCRLQSI